jgi:hypothetical protein
MSALALYEMIAGGGINYSPQAAVRRGAECAGYPHRLSVAYQLLGVQSFHWLYANVNS